MSIEIVSFPIQQIVIFHICWETERVAPHIPTVLHRQWPPHMVSATAVTAVAAVFAAAAAATAVLAAVLKVSCWMASCAGNMFQTTKQLIIPQGSSRTVLGSGSGV